MATIKQLRGESEPNKIQAAEIEILSSEPLLGIILFDTDFGMIRLSVNRMIAEMLRDEIDTFLDME